MGSTPSQQKHDKVAQTMKDLFSSQGLKYKTDFVLYNVPLDTIPGWLYTLEAGFNNKQTLVMVHGYGSNIAFFYQIIPLLAQHFHIYAFDMYGMGNSYRYNFDILKNTEQALELYTKSIEEWRIKLGLDNFYILGHSLGGYLTNHYLHRYNPKVHGVFMISPAGIIKRNKKEFNKYIKEMESPKTGKKIGYVSRKFLTLMLYLIQDRKWSPFSFLNVLPTNKALKGYFGSPRFNLPEKDKQLLIDYYKSILD